MLSFFRSSSSVPRSSLQDLLPKDIVVKKNSRAKRLILKKKESQNSFVLTLPPRVSDRTILRFLQESEPWIIKQRQNMTPKQYFTKGIKFELCGCDVTVIHQSDHARKRTYLEEDKLYVFGDPELVHQRVIRFLKKHAYVCFKERLFFYESQIHKEHKKLVVKDTISRWGSCSSEGEISLSWRLLLAPSFVMDYVIAHEVSHMLYMNHSADFWKLCEEIMPETKKAKSWLKKNGIQLHRFAS